MRPLAALPLLTAAPPMSVEPDQPPLTPAQAGPAAPGPLVPGVTAHERAGDAGAQQELGAAQSARAMLGATVGSPPVGTPSFSPLYQQIKRLLLASLQAGEWGPADVIPSEVELAARFRVSQGTVRKAIDELAAENLLVRKQGKGTYVATHAEAQVQYRFLRLRPDRSGELAVSAQRQFLDCKRLPAPEDVASLLQLGEGEDVFEIRRVLHFDGQPTVLDDIWLPAQLFKGLSTEQLSEYRGPMYGLFETEFGVRMIRAEEKLRAVAASVDVAQLLHVLPACPLLSVERLAYTYGDQPVELRRGLYRTDAHHYRNELG